MDTMLVPPWLKPLLNTSFFNVCRIHGDAARSECNMFCLDCNVDAFCFYCRSSRHKDHQVIQLVGIKINGNASFVIDANNKEVSTMEEGMSRQQEEELREGSQQGMDPTTPPSNSRRRKGIPHRAPFGS
ncbi:hypothetical protein L195_g003459 [Trifolium pratense]|uniref:B box-type domain-containing protein n=1 Tax=Trifolium pratense TaxID=57577 RepID=A0A2K3NVA6_TRIPR|nr:hypothetical protein L195_g003459 [Trifolium pratense]